MAQHSSFNWQDPLLIDQQLSEEERQIRDMAHDYCQEQLQPRVLQAFRHEHFEREIMQEMGALGLLGACVDPQYGGSGLTEPNHGSDPGSMITRATRVDGGYRLNGQKMWITNRRNPEFAQGSFQATCSETRSIAKCRLE